ncbi:MAG: glycosyltransferase [Rhodospirillaceae bacterium]
MTSRPVNDTTETKIVHIAASRLPGQAANAFQTVKMAQAFADRVGRTLLVAGQLPGTPLPEQETLMRIYGVRRLPELRLLPMEGRLGSHLFNVRAAALARRRRPGLVISRSIGAAALSARLNIPTVWECHAPPQGGELLYWRALAGARGFRRLAVISGALGTIMAERHPETAAMDVVVAHDGVDTAPFAALPDPASARRTAGRDPARPVAAYAGHLYAGRGVELILDCAAALPHWTFLVVGGTPDDVRRIEALVAARPLANVELAGFVNNAELPETLAVADVLLMPYQRRVMISGGRLDTAQWMSPLKMFEYLAMGRAILSSDLPVLREVLDDGTAILLDPDRPDAWIAALQRLEDPGLRDGFATSAAALAGRYSWTARAARLTAGLDARR